MPDTLQIQGRHKDEVIGDSVLCQPAYRLNLLDYIREYLV